MIKRINLWVIAFREIFLNKFLFGTNVIVCCLLYGVTLSIMGIIWALPNELQQEVLNTDIGEIQVANVDYKDIEYLKRLPISLYSFGYDMDWSMFEDSLTSKQKEMNTINNIDNSINFCLYNKKSSVFNDINNNIVSGECWIASDDDDNSMNPMWIDSEFAKYMELQVNDIIHLSNEDCDETFYIKGIYCDSEDTMAASYISVNLYGILKCDLNNTLIIYASCDTSPLKFLSTINQLKNQYFIVDSQEDNLYAMFLIMILICCFVVFIFAATIMIILDFLNVYYRKRQKFWAINRALGMSEKNMKCVFFDISFTILLFSFVLGFILSKLLMVYFTNFIISLFDFYNLQIKNSLLQISLVFWGATVITICCIQSKNIVVSEDIRN